MVPRAVVLTNKISGPRVAAADRESLSAAASRRVHRWGVFLLAVCLAGLTGCSPPGPKTLLEGKQALEEGRFPEAVAKMEKAVSYLPKAAVAWNYLGLAYQQNQQLDQSARAYRTALSLDRNLSIARYNLGCVYLDQENLPAAVEELRSYTLLQPAAAEGWLRLGTALYRGKRFEDAERSFRAALDVHPRHPEALNGLGLIQLQRRRWQDALNHFNAAATQDPPYAPALLNSAIVAQQFPNQKALALQRYRTYLALEPRRSDWSSVEASARQLDREINPRPTLPANTRPAGPGQTGLAGTPASRSNGTVAATAPRPANSRTNLATASNPRPGIPSSLLPLTNYLATTARGNSDPSRNTAGSPSPNPPHNNVAVSALPVPPNPVTSTSVPAPASPPSTAPIAARPPAPALPPTVRLPGPAVAGAAPAARLSNPEVTQVTLVSPGLVIPPAQELTPGGLNPGTPPGATVAPVTPSAATPLPAPRVSEPAPAPARGNLEPPRKGLLSRLNPFPTRTRTGGDLEPGEGTATASAGPNRPIPRYNYLSPAAPTPGSRAEGEKSFHKGLKSQKAGNRSQAIAEYQAAVHDDPAYYDAYYNLGLAALENSDPSLALWAYEVALSLKPEDDDARYNLALALRTGGYFLDAIEELKRNLAHHPNEVRYHLSIANLYAQQLREVTLARRHYEKVLDLNPNHSESTRIRFWLAANPA